MNKDLTCISDLNLDDVNNLLKSASAFKQKHDAGLRREDILQGKVVAMIFEKPSLRTKIAFEVATAYLGGIPVFLSSSQILASGSNERGRESVPDIARNLERLSDLIVARVYSHDVIKEISESVSNPVINALCDKHHPTQALADLMAIRMHLTKKDIKVAYIGDGNNVATSLLQVCALAGFHFSIASPNDFGIPIAEKEVAVRMAIASGSILSFETDPYTAVRNADVVYTDTFVSMGQEKDKLERLQIFSGYQVTLNLMSKAARGAKFMHCLPAHRGEEVLNEVMDAPYSIIFDQAECRLHIAKALLQALTKPNRSS